MFKLVFALINYNLDLAQTRQSARMIKRITRKMSSSRCYETACQEDHKKELEIENVGVFYFEIYFSR
jgi:hypothetical protein